MTPEELLKPRYKVIAEYPNSLLPIGSIIQDDVESTTIISPDGSVDIISSYLLRDKHKYPHLFRKLEWWEERKRGEMPKYVKCELSHEVEKIDSHCTDYQSDNGNFEYRPNLEKFIIYQKNLGTESCCAWYRDYLPATQQEYNECISLNNKIK